MNRHTLSSPMEEAMETVADSTYEKRLNDMKDLEKKEEA